MTSYFFLMCISFVWMGKMEFLLGVPPHVIKFKKRNILNALFCFYYLQTIFSDISTHSSLCCSLCKFSFIFLPIFLSVFFSLYHLFDSPFLHTFSTFFPLSPSSFLHCLFSSSLPLPSSFLIFYNLSSSPFPSFLFLFSLSSIVSPVIISLPIPSFSPSNNVSCHSPTPSSINSPSPNLFANVSPLLPSHPSRVISHSRNNASPIPPTYLLFHSHQIFFFFFTPPLPSINTFPLL